MVLTQVDLLDVGQQSLLVVHPQSGEVFRGRKLAAGEFQSQLQTLSPHVVKVLHPTWNKAQVRRSWKDSEEHRCEINRDPPTFQRVPLVTVDDAVLERADILTLVP